MPLINKSVCRMIVDKCGRRRSKLVASLEKGDLITICEHGRRTKHTRSSEGRELVDATLRGGQCANGESSRAQSPHRRTADGSSPAHRGTTVVPSQPAKAGDRMKPTFRLASGRHIITATQLDGLLQHRTTGHSCVHPILIARFAELPHSEIERMANQPK